MKINILGAEYDFAESSAKEDVRLQENDGYHDGYAKIIRVESDYNENNSQSIQNFDEFRKMIKRHELVHAFFFASGLREYSDNELLVDWIAMQFPQMFSVFKEVGAV